MKILDNYDYIVNDTTGIVKYLFKVQNPVIPQFISYCSVINNPVIFPDHNESKKKDTIICGGTSLDEKIALIKCLGESLERYAAYTVNYENYIRGSFNELTERGCKCINMDDFAFFTDEQYKIERFPFKKIYNDTVLYWSEAKSLNNNDTVLCPSELIFINHVEDFKINYNISTGQACGETLEDALLTAIYESIERDSFIMTWKKKISFPVIDNETIDDDYIKKLLNIFINRGIEIKLIKAEMEYGIPTIIGILYNNNIKYYNILVDTATKSTYKEAIISVLESLVNLLYYNFRNYNKKNNNIAYNEITTLEDHNLVFKDKSRKHEIDFIVQGKKISYRNLNEEDKNNKYKYKSQLINECVDKLQRCGIKSYYCDITTKDIKTLGFYVVQSIIPELLNFEINHNYMYLGGRRLNQANSLFKKYKHIEGINCVPHPFL